MIASDSKQYKEVKNYYMLGGILSTVFRIQVNLINNKTIYEEKYGRWNSFQMKVNQKSVLFINIYQMLEGTSEGILTVKVQLDKVTNYLKPAKAH